MNKLKVIWKDVVSYEGLYQVSNTGLVKSLDRIIHRKKGGDANYKSVLLKTYFVKGYEYVVLSKNGIESKKKVHRLVAEAFIPNPDSFPDVNHKDENKKNNSADNLEWCSKVYNREYGTRQFRGRQTMREKFGIAVCRYDLNGNYIKTYSCTSDLKLDGFDRRAVSRCCNGKSNTYKESVWCYADQPFVLRANKHFTKVLKHDLQGNFIASYDSIVEAEKANNIISCSLKSLKYGDRKNPIINGYRYSFDI